MVSFVKLPACPALSPANPIARLALCWVLVGTLCGVARAQTYTQGLPTVGSNSLGPTAAPSQMFVDATQFNGGDMCAKIANACSKLNATSTTYPAGAAIDARGFTGNQVCAAGNITTMLYKCVPGTANGAVGGKLLLGEVNLYADGPTSGNYSDGSSGIGTPALIIPSFFWGIEGVSRGASAGNGNTHPPPGPGTFLSVCLGSGNPINNTNAGTGSPLCNNAFPVRSFSVTSTVVATTSGVTTMTMTVSPAANFGVNPNIYPGELVMMKGNTTVPAENGTYKVQNASGSTIQVTVPSTTLGCTSATCGTLYLGTPILGFGGSMSYNNSSCYPGAGNLCSGFGEHIKNLGFNCQAQDGCIGWQNLYAEEESGADTFLITQLNFVGADVHNPALGTQNFGPILNAEIYTGPNNTACDYGTTGVYIGDAQMRGLNAWSIVQTNPGSAIPGPVCNKPPIAAILFDAPNTEVINGHCEGFNNCVLVGANNAPNTTTGALGASGDKVSTVAGATCSNAPCDVVHITKNYPNNTDYVIQNIRRKSNFTNTIVDDINGVTIGASTDNDLFTGFYSWGSGINNSPSTVLTNLMTTDVSTVNQFGSGVTAATYGTTSNCASASGSCGSATAGRVTIASVALTVTVSTTVVTANSEIYVQEDATLGPALGVTCNATGGRTYTVTSRTAGTSFIITASSAPITHPACLSFHIVN